MSVENCMGKNNKFYFESISLLLYGSLSFIWLWMHEPWRDEAQAWLIVRDLDIYGIIKQMVWEGTPALWHMLIFPTVKLGLPYFCMFILHWIIAIVIAWLLLFKLNLSNYIKIGLLFSYFLMFEYVLVARNYSISILLLIIIASLYGSRFKKPVLFSILILLLFNTNIHSFGAATALSIIYLWELCKSIKVRIHYLIALTIMITGAVLVFLQIFPVNSLEQNAIIEKSAFNFYSIFIAIRNGFLPGYDLNFLFSFIFSLLLLLFLIRALVRPKIFVILFLSVGWLLFILGTIHLGGLRHHGFVLIFIIFSFSLEKYYEIEPLNISFCRINLNILNKLSSIILVLCLFLSIIQSIKAYYNELKFSYSGSKEAAEFVKTYIPVEQLIIVHRSYSCCSLLPYLDDYKFWYADSEEFGTFLIWDMKFKENAYTLSNSEVIERADKNFSNSTVKILILTKPIIGSKLDEYELIYTTQKKVFCKKDEQFYIYQEKHER